METNMNDKNNSPGGSSGIKDISQMTMGGVGNAAKKSPQNTMPDLRRYKKPVLFAAAGLLAVVLLVIAAKALSGGKYTQKDYEEAAMLVLQLPTTEKELDAWKDGLRDCYPSEAEEMLKELHSSGESYVELMAEVEEEMEEEEAEEFELLREIMSSIKVSDSRMLDREECEECVELIRKYHDITIEIDGGCLVEMEIVLDPKLEKKLEELEIDPEELGDLEDAGSVILVLRSGKYIGPWASADGLKLDEITSLRRDLNWEW